MSEWRRAKVRTRRDDNHDDLVEAAENLGCKVVIAGPLDLWCGVRGRWYPTEIKTDHGRYTPFQTAFLEDCKNSSLPVWTWRTFDDVLKCINCLT